MDTPENHRRLGEIRAGELERAMGVLGVTEWENLGYRDSGMMGTDGNRDPRSFWQADLDEAAGRLTWLVRRYQPDVITTYNDFGGYGHPDHIRTHDVAVRAFERAGDPAWYPEQLEDAGASSRGRHRSSTSQAIPASVRERMDAQAEGDSAREPFWAPPDDATPEQIAEFEEFAAKMLVPDEPITTWVDVSGAPLEAKWDAIHEHVTQISDRQPVHAPGLRWLAGGLGERGLHPARVARRRTDAPRDGPVRRDRLGRVGAVTRAARPLRRREDLAHDDPAGAGRVEEVRLCLVEDDVRPHPDLDEVRAAERQLEGDPLHRRLRPGLVEDEVAERVPDRLALVDLHRGRPSARGCR